MTRTRVASWQASGAAWKERVAAAPAAPAWVRGVMANGFRSPLGALAIGGLMGCPLWAWACRCDPGQAGCAAPRLQLLRGPNVVVMQRALVMQRAHV